MHLRFLKPFRVVVSLLFFFLTLFIFVDFASLLSARLIGGLLYFQFVPSALKFSGTFALVSTGFLAILLLTLFFGRVYCSTICPLGTLQDFVIGVGVRLKRWKNFKFRKPLKGVRYSVLAITLLVLVFHSIFFLNLLDPYSLSGKLFTNLFRPVYIGGNNLLARILHFYNNYTLYLVSLKIISPGSFVLALLIFFTIIMLAMFKDRWYCNVICPVGTFLGLLSRISLFKLSINQSECTRCGLCEHVCKADCIDFKGKLIDFDRCVSCFNCLRACPHHGIGYEFRKKENKISGVQADVNDSRRIFIKSAVAGTVGIAGLLGGKRAMASNEKTVSSWPVTPPGSLSYWHYTTYCTSCHLCISVCPTHVLQPSLFEFGLNGIMQPKMDFKTNYCNFDCVICSQVCPTGAIRPQLKEDKQRIQTGISVFVKNICIVVEKHTACGACSEHCPTKAVEMVPYLNNLRIPKVDAKICVGCGACEHACPTKPEKAIYVESNLYHRWAQKPLKKVEESKPAEKNVKKTEKKKGEDDFPF